MKNMVRAFEHLEIVVIDFSLIQEAVDTSILQRISFWDALIAVAASSAQCEYLFIISLYRGFEFGSGHPRREGAKPLHLLYGLTGVLSPPRHRHRRFS